MLIVNSKLTITVTAASVNMVTRSSVNIFTFGGDDGMIMQKL